MLRPRERYPLEPFADQGCWLALGHESIGVQVFRFRSGASLGLALVGLAILAFPVLLWLIATFGKCAIGAEPRTCENVPDGFAVMITEFVFSLAFGGGIVVSGVLAIAAIGMLIAAIRLEWSARRNRNK
jgi:hypothetical protein